MRCADESENSRQNFPCPIEVLGLRLFASPNWRRLNRCERPPIQHGEHRVLTNPPHARLVRSRTAPLTNQFCQFRRLILWPKPPPQRGPAPPKEEGQGRNPTWIQCLRAWGRTKARP